ncbi:MAG: hypothetical protein AAF492_00295 [Verrucomicrobiota bacterium]
MKRTIISAIATLLFAGLSAFGQTVTVCHVPPGDPTGAQTLILPDPSAALTAHLNGGGKVGACNFNAPGNGPAGGGPAVGGPAGGAVGPSPNTTTATGVGPKPQDDDDPVVRRGRRETVEPEPQGEDVELRDIIILRDKEIWKDYASVLEMILKLDIEHSTIDFD